MREIKFRALNANNELIYGLPYTDGVNETVYFKEYNNRLCWRDKEGGHCNQPYKNGTLSQFTGLCDKNGVEIYERDIMESPKGILFKVVWFHKKARYGVMCKNIWNKKSSTAFIKSLTWAYNNCVVVGNIYQNQELLKD